MINFKLLRECAAGAPEGWRVTPRKVDVPREKPWLWRRTAMISSSSVMLSRQAVRSAYLHARPLSAPPPGCRPSVVTQMQRTDDVQRVLLHCIQGTCICMFPTQLHLQNKLSRNRAR